MRRAWAVAVKELRQIRRDRRTLGILGEPRVYVLELTLLLDSPLSR